MHTSHSLPARRFSLLGSNVQGKSSLEKVEQTSAEETVDNSFCARTPTPPGSGERPQGTRSSGCTKTTTVLPARNPTPRVPVPSRIPLRVSYPPPFALPSSWLQLSCRLSRLPCRPVGSVADDTSHVAFAHLGRTAKQHRSHVELQDGDGSDSVGAVVPPCLSSCFTTGDLPLCFLVALCGSGAGKAVSET